VSGSPVILASGSPRRKQLLELIGIDFEVIPSGVEENPNTGESPPAFALRAAGDKALDVASRHPDRWVLGADTVVELDGSILGKPPDDGSAREMLRSLSGRKHRVHTGMCLAIGSVRNQLVDTATVSFANLREDVISWYVDSGEPRDKAGAYAIQGIGGLLVERMEGSPHTVVGLPIHRLPELFASHEIDFWDLVRPIR